MGHVYTVVLLSVGLSLAAAVTLLLNLRFRRRLEVHGVGRVSERWLAEHQASPPGQG